MRSRKPVTILLLFIMVCSVICCLPYIRGPMTIPTVEIIFDEETVHADVSGDENITVEIKGVLKVDWVDYVDEIDISISAYSSVFSDLDWNLSVVLQKPDDTASFNFHVEVEKHSYSEEKHVVVGGSYSYTDGVVDYTFPMESTAYIQIDPYYELSIGDDDDFRSCAAERGSYGEFFFIIMNQGNADDIVTLFLMNKDDLENNGIEVSFPDDESIMAGDEEMFKVRTNVSNGTSVGTYPIQIGVIHMDEGGNHVVAEGVSVTLELEVVRSDDGLGYPSTGVIILLLLSILTVILVKNGPRKGRCMR